MSWSPNTKSLSNKSTVQTGRKWLAVSDTQRRHEVLCLPKFMTKAPLKTKHRYPCNHPPKWNSKGISRPSRPAIPHVRLSMNFGQWSRSRRLGVKRCGWEHRLNKVCQPTKRRALCTTNMNRSFNGVGRYLRWKARKRREMDSRDANTGKAFELLEFKSFNFTSF